MTVIHWFRRDLRLTDNTAFNAAVRESSRDVLPLFILDTALLAGKDVAPARVQFMLESLRELDANLKKRGSRLVVLRGNPQTELPKLATSIGASAIYWNRDYTPTARKRDDAIAEALRTASCEPKSYKDLVMWEQDELQTNTGKPYTVFTPYKKAWLLRAGSISVDRFNEYTLKAPAKVEGEIALPSLKDLGLSLNQQVPKGGEAEALRLLNDFAESERLNRYNTDRDFPGIEGTSRLSPHLRFGTISPRLCYETAAKNVNYVIPSRQSLSPQSSDPKKAGGDSWISELIWREFYMQVLYHFPHADQYNFNKTYDAVQWGNGSEAKDKAYFQAWCEGKTGYPIVDAAMRQLNQSAWMHNRCRMIVASFLTKDLLLDWRLGEHYFMQKLVDGDPASNNGGWQWAAGTGTDAQPYFRVFNPILQSQRFDPKGDYIRKWLPELARVSDEDIHEPWNMPPMLQLTTNCVIGKTYTARIVDHAAQKDKAIAMFKAAK
jgi:deoxyribodipyrimidine photo-lyase